VRASFCEPLHGCATDTTRATGYDSHAVAQEVSGKAACPSFCKDYQFGTPIDLAAERVTMLFSFTAGRTPQAPFESSFCGVLIEDFVPQQSCCNFLALKCHIVGYFYAEREGYFRKLGTS